MTLASEIAELEALAEKATPGPSAYTDETRAYIAACSTDRIQRVLARLRKQQEALVAVRILATDAIHGDLTGARAAVEINNIARAALEDET